MSELYKVTERSPETSKNGVTIKLKVAGEDTAVIIINGVQELFCEYHITYPIEIDSTEYTIKLSNTFIEHWGKVVKCCVFVIKKVKNE